MISIQNVSKQFGSMYALSRNGRENRHHRTIWFGKEHADPLYQRT